MLQHLLRSIHPSAESVSTSTQQQPDADDDYETFSTPPTTPMIPSPLSSVSTPSSSSRSDPAPDTERADNTRPPSAPSLSRRNSRPTSLHLAGSNPQDWTPGIELESGVVSPDIVRRRENDGSELDNRNNQASAACPGPGRDPTSTTASHPAAERETALTPQPRPAAAAAGRGPRAGAATSASQPVVQHLITSDPGALSSTDTQVSTSASGSSTITQQRTPSGTSHIHQPTSLKSPCFVHSYLDKGASLADWLRSKQDTMMSVSRGFTGPSPPLLPHPAHSLPHSPLHSPGLHTQPHSHIGQGHHHHYQAIHPVMPSSYSQSSPGSSPSSDFDDDDDGAASLTRQLAETAVGVREMSKQLGRARVRSNIQNVLIITKARDNRLIKLTRELALYLMQKPRYGGRGLVVYVDNQLRNSKRFDAAGMEREFPELFVPFPRRRSSSNNSLASMVNGNNSNPEFHHLKDDGQLRYWTSEMCNRSPHLFDFVVTLGGDGTVLFTSWLFQRIVPPVLPFALGSLGFLTNFDFADHRAVMDSAIDNGIRVNLRMRFTCTVYRAVAPEPGKGRRAVKKAETGEIMMRNIEKGGWEALEGGWGEGAGAKESKKSAKDKEIMCFTTRPVESFEVLNDLVVDRGPSPYMSLLELFGDEHHMTTVQADGLTVSTPTGSTAYSLSAGGSLVHPEIPAILISPICPHTLSFRPMLLPDSMELRICVPFNSRSTAWASFDGRGRVELKQGDHIKVTASKYPFPTVCADKQSTDWFHAISRTLKWNERERQKSFVVVEEGPAKSRSGKTKKGGGDGVVTATVTKPGIPEVEQEQDDSEEDEVSDEEEEEEKFDIDDSSAPEASAMPTSTELVAMEKAQPEKRKKHDEDLRARAAAIALAGPEFHSTRPGIETPDRFAGAHPHPPGVSPRHVSFSEGSDASGAGAGASSDAESLRSGHAAEKGERDHIHAPQMLNGTRSRIPRDRDVESESASLKTPTPADHWSGRAHAASAPAPALRHRSRSREGGGQPRAFAVWGQDESDSNASDSDV
ncbi:hypothetical protein M0805_005684 [Coniferiporia weirii]|nr:hypothetical protein M0805_005684 [Coniferiporia weirii]